jgi:hypothetical protein
MCVYVCMAVCVSVCVLCMCVWRRWWWGDWGGGGTELARSLSRYAITVFLYGRGRRGGGGRGAHNSHALLGRGIDLAAVLISHLLHLHTHPRFSETPQNIYKFLGNLAKY